MIRRNISNGIATCLNGMHVDLGQGVENIGNIDQAGPIKLDVLTRRKVSVSFIKSIRDVGQLVQLPTGQRTVGYCDPKHVSVQL